MASSFDFQTEWVEEGKVKVLVPKLSAFIEGPSDYAPSKAPVFYNPAMEFNRDVAVLALRAYQRTIERAVKVCEPMAGCGIRGVRFAKEVEGIAKVVMNDLNPNAVKLMRFNVEWNGLSDLVDVENKDANLLLSGHAAPGKRFDYVDVDPFGSPAPYLDSAVRALKDGGLIGLTATDMAPLCGVHPKACLRKYGGRPLRTEYAHELAVRLLLGCLASTAARHDMGVKPVFSHSADHYVRAYATLRHGAKEADESLHEMGFVIHCFNCFHREALRGYSVNVSECPKCGAKVGAAGPLWVGRIADEGFCEIMKEEVDRTSFRNEREVRKLVATVREEANAPITYYVVDRICDKLGLSTPHLEGVTRGLKEGSYVAVLTHFKRNGIRTDAPSAKVIDVIKASQKTPDLIGEMNGVNLKRFLPKALSGTLPDVDGCPNAE